MADAHDFCHISRCLFTSIINIKIFQYFYIMKRRVYKKEPVFPDSLSTSTKLVIVESPSKCSKIESYLGSQYTCIASMGHIRNIDGLKSIDSSYNITYSFIDEKKGHVKWMREIIGKFDRSKIFLATDDDREGEAIAWHICKVFDLPVETTHRIIFREITSPAIKAAIENPGLININKINAQQARQVLDLLVGYRISPILWKHLYYNKDNSLSAGRCQTPALRLLYENDEESKKINLEKSYQIRAGFYPKNIEFILSKKIKSEADVLDFLEKSKKYNHSVSIGCKKECIHAPPKPFNTSLLLQMAASELNISPKETMQQCQELYQNGYITYMRTESQKYSIDFLKTAEKFIESRFQEKIGENLNNTDSENPHEAIRVTNINVEKIEAKRGQALYKFIWKNTVASCMMPSKHYNICISMDAPMDYHYNHTIEIPIYLGWKKTEKPKSCDNSLLYIESSPKENIRFNSIQAEISISGRHSHYTEATLIKKLEDLGIGRPSTFATIVETILERKYVEKKDISGVVIKASEYVLENSEIIERKIDKTIGNEKGKLVINPIGISVSDFLNDHFSSLFEYGYTRKMEEILDNIAVTTEREPWNKICEDCEKEIDDCIKNTDTKKEVFKLVDTDEYSVVYEKYGLVIKKDNGKYESIKKDLIIDMKKLKSGNYSLEELIENKVEKYIGIYKESPVILKTGAYGKYLEYKDEKIGFKTLSLDDNDSEEKIMSAFINSRTITDNHLIIRELTPTISIRNGKYGAYIYYKKPDMKKPQFFNLKKFKESYIFCDKEKILSWIKENHNIY